MVLVGIAYILGDISMPFPGKVIDHHRLDLLVEIRLPEQKSIAAAELRFFKGYECQLV